PMPAASAPAEARPATSPPAEARPESPAPAPPVPANGKPAPSPVAAAPDPPIATRWATLRRGDWAAASAQGSAHQAHLGGAWVLRLEVACQPETLARAVAAFPRESDLFLVPLRMKDGRTCRQICFGSFRSEAEAQAAAERLPALFREGGNKPRAYQASALPEKQ
ncbi:MAG TPA: hypothetical protein VFT46_06060, partial [Holophagaceae bacterium]|nr:hypothetical protein [Holophagaceae bacterium]